MPFTVLNIFNWINPKRVGVGVGGGYHRTVKNIAIAQYNALTIDHRVYVNSPMSIPVSLAPFLGQMGARFYLGGAWEPAGPPNLEFPEI